MYFSTAITLAVEGMKGLHKRSQQLYRSVERLTVFSLSFSFSLSLSLFLSFSLSLFLSFSLSLFLSFSFSFSLFFFDFFFDRWHYKGMQETKVLCYKLGSIIILLFYYFIVLLFYYFIILLFYYFIILLFYYFIILLFYYFIILLFDYLIVSFSKIFTFKIIN